MPVLDAPVVEARDEGSNAAHLAVTFDVRNSSSPCSKLAQAAPKKSGGGGLMMNAYRAFTGKAISNGYTMASAAELWKHSHVRRTVSENQVRIYRFVARSCAQGPDREYERCREEETSL